MKQINLLIKLSITPAKSASWQKRVETLMVNVLSGDLHNHLISVEEVVVDEPKVKKVAVKRKVKR